MAQYRPQGLSWVYRGEVYYESSFCTVSVRTWPAVSTRRPPPTFGSTVGLITEAQGRWLWIRMLCQISCVEGVFGAVLRTLLETPVSCIRVPGFMFQLCSGSSFQLMHNSAGCMCWLWYRIPATHVWELDGVLGSVNQQMEAHSFSPSLCLFFSLPFK